MDHRLKRFITPDYNQSEFKNAQDFAGRWCLPLDSVYYKHKTDEGQDIFVSGKVIEVHEDHLIIKNDFSRPVSIHGKNVLRMPPEYGPLHKLLVRHLYQMNLSIMEHHSGNLHIDGVRLHAYFS